MPKLQLKALTLLTFVGSLALFVQGADTAPPAKVLKPATSFVLPSRFSEAFFYLSVRIGDEGPFNLILDTGASYLCISSEVAARLRESGRLTDLHSIRVDTASRTEPTVNLAVLSDVRFGDFIARRLKAVVTDMSVLSGVAGEHLDGIVGMEAFEFGDFVLDYPGRQIRVETSGARDTNAVVLNCELQFHRPIVTLDLGGRKFQMFVDSGSSGGFDLPAATENLPFAASPVTVGLAANLADVVEEKAARLATNLIWGGVTFERPTVNLAEVDIGRIGKEVLQNFVVRIDQRRKELVLTPPAQTVVPSRPIRSTGLSLLPDGLRLKVLAVIPDTAAARAGIQRGDYVVNVNGEPARRWNSKRLRELRDKADSFEIELVRGDKTERLRLQVATLVE